MDNADCSSNFQELVGLDTVPAVDTEFLNVFTSSCLEKGYLLQVEVSSFL